MARRKVTNSLSSTEQDELIKNKSIQNKVMHRKVSKIVALALVVALLITGSAWGVLSFIEQNSMKIVINKGVDGLALDVDKAFERPTSRIVMKGPENLDNITISDIDFKNKIFADGVSLANEKYFAYSFYIKNVSSLKACYYNLAVNLANNTKNADSAIRMMLVKNSDKDEREAVVYAKMRSDLTPEYICYDSDIADEQLPWSVEEVKMYLGDLVKTNVTTPFLGVTPDGNLIAQNKDQRMPSLAIEKYTVVIWVEGSDSDCKNSIRGGTIKIDLQFDLVRYDDVVLPDDMLG